MHLRVSGARIGSKPAHRSPAMPMAPEDCDDLRVAVRADANVLKPFLGFDDTDKFCVSWICERPLGYDIESVLGPGLAGSLMWDPGHVGATLELNPDVRWSDGRPVTPQYVVFSLQYVQQRFPVFYAVAHTFGGHEAVDQHSVHISFNGPQVNAPCLAGTMIIRFHAAGLGVAGTVEPASRGPLI